MSGSQWDQDNRPVRIYTHPFVEYHRRFSTLKSATSVLETGSKDENLIKFNDYYYQEYFTQYWYDMIETANQSIKSKENGEKTISTWELLARRSCLQK